MQTQTQHTLGFDPDWFPLAPRFGCGRLHPALVPVPPRQAASRPIPTGTPHSRTPRHTSMRFANTRRERDSHSSSSSPTAAPCPIGSYRRSFGARSLRGATGRSGTALSLPMRGKQHGDDWRATGQPASSRRQGARLHRSLFPLRLGSQATRLSRRTHRMPAA